MVKKKNKRGFRYPNTASRHCNTTTTVIEWVDVAGSSNMVTQKTDSLTGRVSVRVQYLPYPLRLPPIILPYHLSYSPSHLNATAALHKHTTLDTTETTLVDASILAFDDHATKAQQEDQQQRRERRRPSPHTRSIVEQALQQRVRMAQQRRQHQLVPSPRASSILTTRADTNDLRETGPADDDKFKKRRKALSDKLKRAAAGLSVAWQHTRTSLRPNLNNQEAHSII
ncbi:hypothetical protein BCR43DRAFT_481742, partial [Syncephalastrum racemosum]